MPESKFVKMTPAMATELLAQHPKNRKLSAQRVAKYARDMQDGRWIFDGQPIRVNAQGSLVDGQHRLNAIIESGTTQDMLIVTGVPIEAMATMDTGKSRSFSDILTMEDPELGNVVTLAASVRLIYMWQKGIRGRNLTGTLSAGNPLAAGPDQLLAFFRLYKEELVGTNKIGQNLRAKVPGTSTAAMAAAYWVLVSTDGADADYFFERLGDGIGLAAGHPLLALRKVLTANATSREKLQTYEVLAFIFKTWNLYRDGKTISILTWKQGGAHPEAFPEPH